MDFLQVHLFVKTGNRELVSNRIVEPQQFLS